MKSIKFLDNESIVNIKSMYNLKKLQVIKYKKYDFISIFIEDVSSDSLQKNWQKISNVLSESLEEFFINDFIRWNVYILYVVHDDVSKELKYKIENNTFFARKIVESNYPSELIDENIKKLIEEHITFNDITLTTTTPSSDTYSSESKIYLELKDLDNIDEIKIDEILNVLEEGIKNEI